MRRRAVLFAAVTLAAVAAGAGLRIALREAPQAPDTAATAQLVGSLRPDFTLPDVSGRPRSVAEWDGKVLVLNFWATWCPPCRKEIPEFVELQERYGARGLQFVGVALQRPEELGAFIEEHGMNYPVLAGEMEVIRLAERYGNRVGALPYTVIMDRGGRIVFVRPGPLHGVEAEGIIAPLL